MVSEITPLLIKTINSYFVAARHFQFLIWGTMLMFLCIACPVVSVDKSNLASFLKLSTHPDKQAGKPNPVYYHNKGS